MNLKQQQSTQQNIENVQPDQAKHKHDRLTFLVTEYAIKEWLESIKLKQPVQATNELYNTLKILLKHQDEYQQQLCTILPLITPVIIQNCQHLEQLFCTSAKNIDDKKRKIARLSINTLRYLVILYQNLSLSIDTNTQLALNYIHSLQVGYLCLKQCALIYERPSSELWKIIGNIYQSAVDKHLLDLTFKDSIAAVTHQNCITESIKSILLLSLCKPYHLTQLEILRLSNLLDQYHDKLTLSEQQSTHSSHSWNYNSSQAVHVITPNSHIAFSTLFIDSHLLINSLITENFCSITELLTGSQSLIPRLTQTQAFSQKISTGFASIICILEEYKQNEKINKTSEQVLSVSDKLQLQPFNRDHTLKIPGIAKNTSQFDKMSRLFAEAIVKEDANMDFVLIEIAPLTCHIEDLILIIDDQQKLQLGIIRNMAVLKNNQYQLIVEKICTEVQLVSLIYQNSERKAILFKIDTNTTLLIVAPDKYTTGSNIQIDAQSYHLTRLYEATAYFMLYQIRLTD